MDLANTALVNNASSATVGSVSGAAQMMVLKKAMSLQSEGTLELLASVPTPPSLATHGSLGTRLNIYA